MMDELFKIIKTVEQLGFSTSKLDLSRVHARMTAELRKAWPDGYGDLDFYQISFGFREIVEPDRSYFAFTAQVYRQPEPTANHAAKLVVTPEDLAGHTSDCFQPRLGADQLVFFRGRDGSVLLVDEVDVEQIKTWTGDKTLDARLLAARLSDAAERAEAVTLMWQNA